MGIIRGSSGAKFELVDNVVVDEAEGFLSLLELDVLSSATFWRPSYKALSVFRIRNMDKRDSYRATQHSCIVVT